MIVEEVVFGLKLVPEFLTPFGENSQYGWMFDDQVETVDIFLSVWQHIFIDFPAYQKRSVLFDLFSIFFLLDLGLPFFFLEFVSFLFGEFLLLIFIKSKIGHSFSQLIDISAESFLMEDISPGDGSKPELHLFFVHPFLIFYFLKQISEVTLEPFIIRPSILLCQILLRLDIVYLF